MVNVMSMIFWVIVVLGALVFFHELGHFLAAKLTGIRVERFSIGFPPRIWGRKIGDTDYCIQLIPLGGYCKMAGMVDETFDIKGIKGEPWEFMSKPIPVRMFVLFAGPLMNMVVAVILFAVFSFYVGSNEYEKSAAVGNISKGLPAEQAGIKPGDVIIAIDTKPIATWEEMSNIIRPKPLETVIMRIRRGQETIELPVTIGKQDNPTDEVNQEVGFIGIERLVHHRDLNLSQSIRQGFVHTAVLTREIAVTIKSLIAGRESIKALGGPIMIAKMTNDFRRTGTLAFIGFIAFLSLNLGFMNLLPVPVLDGGHLFILAVEGIVRKQLPVKAKVIIQQIGMLLLFGLIIVILYNDIVRLAFSNG